jgi:SAM-dependent methyltransferase
MVRLGRGGARHSPYPLSVAKREIPKQEVPAGGGTETFDQAHYTEINEARMRHLAWLGLGLEGKRVLDVGCGVGDLDHFFISRGCSVVCLDGREENVAALRQRHPGLEAHVADVEVDSLSRFGTFDVVFCYGLLYHLENPLIALRNMASVCKEMLLLETMVTDHVEPLLRLQDESSAFSQALRGIACRPTPSYVVLALNRAGFRFVYAPSRPPEHREFQFRWRNNLDWWRDGHPLRCVFVASMNELHNPTLVNLVV